MPRHCLVWFSLLLIGLSACARQPQSGPALAHAAAGPTQPPAATAARTPVPTWTLPFVWTATLAASATPTITPTPSATACAETAGQVTQAAAPSRVLGAPIDALVYLPPCYAASETRYPVLYLIHGLNFTEDQWDRLGAPRAADALAAAGEIAPLIIVMPRDRRDPRLDQAFVMDLVPYVDSSYRTLARREFRAIGGLSRGAGWAVHIGLAHPELFGRIGAHSPAIFIGDEHDIVRWTWHLPDDRIPAVYVDIGESDAALRSAAWFNQVLTTSGIPHTYLVQPGGHSENYWAAHVADYLRFYAGDWRYPSALSGGDTPTPDPADRPVPIP